MSAMASGHQQHKFGDVFVYSFPKLLDLQEGKDILPFFYSYSGLIANIKTASDCFEVY